MKNFQKKVQKKQKNRDFELLNISLIYGTFRMMNDISAYCYNSSGGFRYSSTWWFDMSGTPFRFSDVHNKFTVIGCNTLAYILDNAVKGYQSGCVSTCQNLSDLAMDPALAWAAARQPYPRGWASTT